MNANTSGTEVLLKSGTGLPERFNILARLLHWSMALAILAMLFIGVGMMTSLTWRPWLLDLHQPLGIAILLLAFVRLLNRLRNGAPALPNDIPRWQALAASASHWVLYAFMIFLPLLGWGMRSAGGSQASPFRASYRSIRSGMPCCEMPTVSWLGCCSLWCSCTWRPHLSTLGCVVTQYSQP